MHEHRVQRGEHRDVEGRRNTCAGGLQLRPEPDLRGRPLQHDAHTQLQQRRARRACIETMQAAHTSAPGGGDLATLRRTHVMQGGPWEECPAGCLPAVARENF